MNQPEYVSGCCSSSIIENTDLCNDCKNHCEPELLPDLIEDL